MAGEKLTVFKMITNRSTSYRVDDASGALIQWPVPQMPLLMVGASAREGGGSDGTRASMVHITEESKDLWNLRKAGDEMGSW